MFLWKTRIEFVLLLLSATLTMRLMVKEALNQDAQEFPFSSGGQDSSVRDRHSQTGQQKPSSCQNREIFENSDNRWTLVTNKDSLIGCSAANMSAFFHELWRTFGFRTDRRTVMRSYFCFSLNGSLLSMVGTLFYFSQVSETEHSLEDA